jgi:hypothetical protein
MDGLSEGWMGQGQRPRIIKIKSFGSWKSCRRLLHSLTLDAVSEMSTASRGQDNVSSLPDALT